MKKGISLITLIITIIVIIILAAIVIFTGLRTPDSAQFAKFTQDVDNVQMAVTNKFADLKAKHAIAKEYRTDEQIYIEIARAVDPEQYASMGTTIVNTGDSSIATGSTGIQNIMATRSNLAEGASVTGETKPATGSLGMELPKVRENNTAWYVTKEGRVFNANGYTYSGKTYFDAKHYQEGELGSNSEVNAGRALAVYDAMNKNTVVVTGAPEDGSAGNSAGGSGGSQSSNTGTNNDPYGGLATASEANQSLYFYDILTNPTTALGDGVRVASSSDIKLAQNSTPGTAKIVGINLEYILMQAGFGEDQSQWPSLWSSSETYINAINPYTKKLVIPSEVTLNQQGEFDSNGQTYKVTEIGEFYNPTTKYKTVETGTGTREVVVWGTDSNSDIMNYIWSSSALELNMFVPEGVTSICSLGFSGNISLRSIHLPSTLKSLGSLYNCSNLTSIVIPPSVTSIDSDAFSNCDSLETLTIPVNFDLHGASNVKNLTITGTGSISSNQFCYDTTLEHVTISEGITSIGESAFNDCNNLKSVTIPSSVTSIGNSAFNNCYSLEAISIPNGVTSIGSSAFNSCSGASSITIPSSATSIGNSAFNSCSGASSITIPNGVISIEDYAFSGCSGVSSITIPNSVTRIGSYAFSYCNGIDSIVIPTSVTYMGERVFDSCDSLTTISVPINLDISGNYVTNLILTGTGSIQASEYSGYSGYSFENVTISEGITGIGESAFQGNSYLKNVTIPSTVSSVGNNAFYDCYNMESVTIPSSLEQTGGGTNPYYVWGIHDPTVVTVR